MYFDVILSPPLLLCKIKQNLRAEQQIQGYVIFWPEMTHLPEKQLFLKNH